MLISKVNIMLKVTLWDRYFLISTKKLLMGIFLFLFLFLCFHDGNNCSDSAEEQNVHVYIEAVHVY